MTILDLNLLKYFRKEPEELMYLYIRTYNIITEKYY